LGRRGLDNVTKNDATIDRTVVETTIDETATMKIKIVVLNNLLQLLPPTQADLRTILSLFNNSNNLRLLLVNSTRTNDKTETKQWLSLPV
jgi:DNA-directed RNA polymerase subunit F